MIKTSTSFLEEIKENRRFYVTAKVTLSNGTILNLEKKDFYIGGNSIVETDDSSDFPLGIAIEKTATLSLVNDDDRFSGYDFNKAIFAIYINLDLVDGTTKVIKKGTFVVSKKPSTGERISLTLLDRMYRADKTYSTTLTFPASMRSVLIDACDRSDLSYDISNLKNGSFVVESAPENTTFRAVIGYCAMIAGGNARINEDDQLEIIYFTAIKENVQESEIDTSVYHIFKAITDLKYDVDPVTVTGVRIKGEEKEYLSGQEGYVLTLDNPLIKGKEQEGLGLIANAVIGLKMWPLSFNTLANPTITFLDPAYVYDRKDRCYITYLTDITFDLNNKMELSGSCKSAVEISQEYANDFVNVDQIKEMVNTDQSQYQTAVQHINELAAYTLGFYYTEVKQADGSIVAYRHDQPKLEDSKVVYKNGIDGFFVTQDYRGTDAATQTAGKWSSGFNSNGNAVLNILYAIGINAGWINTGTFKVVDSKKNVMFSADVDTGDVIINAKTLRVGSKDVVTAEDLSDYAQSSEITQTANNIRLQVATAHNKWHTGSYTLAKRGYGTPTSNGYAAKDYKGKYYLDETEGKIYYSDGTTWASKYKCTKQNVISKINLSSGTISLSSGTGINLKTKVFCVDSEYLAIGNKDKGIWDGYLTVRSGKTHYSKWVKIKKGAIYFGYIDTDGKYKQNGSIIDYGSGIKITGSKYILLNAPDIVTYRSNKMVWGSTQNVKLKYVSQLNISKGTCTIITTTLRFVKGLFVGT